MVLSHRSFLLTDLHHYDPCFHGHCSECGRAEASSVHWVEGDNPYREKFNRWKKEPKEPRKYRIYKRSSGWPGTGLWVVARYVPELNEYEQIECHDDFNHLIATNYYASMWRSRKKEPQSHSHPIECGCGLCAANLQSQRNIS